MHPSLTRWGSLGPMVTQAILKQVHTYVLCIVIVCCAVACSSPGDRFTGKSGINCEAEVCVGGWLLRFYMGLSRVPCCNGDAPVSFCGLQTCLASLHYQAASSAFALLF